MGFIIGVILIAIIVICVGVSSTGAKKRQKSKAVAGAVAGVIALALLLVIPGSIHMIDAGEIAVVKVWGKAEYTRSAGTYFDFWLSNVYEVYDAKTQNLDIKSSAYSKDAQNMDISMTVQYRINPNYALDIATKYGELSLLENRVNSACIEKAKSVLSKYSAMEIIENRQKISPEVESVITESISDTYYVNIVTVVLTDIAFSTAFENTVEEKMIAEQEKLKAEYEKEKAVIDAEKELEVAKLEAQAKIAAAEGEAEAQVEIAKSEATATKLKSIEIARMLGFTITESTTGDGENIVTEYNIDFTGKSADEIKLISEYLKYAEYLSVWDGKLPTVLTDGGATVMVTP